MRMTYTRDTDLLVRMARLHYEDNLSQREIAKQLQISVSSVSRALKQARDQGIVEIRIHDPGSRIASLEASLKKRYGLEAAVVVASASSEEATRASLGRAVADFVGTFIHKDSIIGVSDGMTVAAVATSLRAPQPLNVQVVPLVGGVGMPDMYTHPIEVASTVARNLGGITRQLNAPAIVQDAIIRVALLSNPVVSSVFQLIEQCDVAIVGVGAVTEETAMVRNGVMTPLEIEQARMLGAVGAICARFYDAEGMPIHSDLDDRTVSASIDQLRRIQHTIAVAIGTSKTAAIRAALRGKIVRALGTDQTTAADILMSTPT
ncbi:MAG: sugar-binding domain-containing protein [Aggregatilineales bacterium]